MLVLALATAPLFSQVLVDTFAGGKIRSGVPAQDVPLAPGGIAFDPAGNLVLCDQISNVIRRVRGDGTIETLAGNGATGFSGDGGPALNAALNQPDLPRFDAQGNLYFADRSNNRIRRVDPKGVITSIAGSGVPFQPGMDLEGPALSRSLATIGDLAVDPGGNVYFTIAYNYDGDVMIRRVTTSGRLEIFAGIPHPDCPDCTDGDNGPALAARIVPGFLAADGKGNLFVSEYATVSGTASATHIRRIAPDGTITRFAGYGPSPTGNTVDDEAKPALDIYIFRIGGMAADSTGNLYFVHAPGPTDRTGSRIRRIDTNGIVNTLAGGSSCSTAPDGPPLETSINPQTIAADAHGNVAFTDGSAGAVREVTAQPIMQTLAGGNPKPAPDGTPARDAWLLNPIGIAINRAGDLFIAERGTCLIRKIGANGLLATAAGTGKCGTSQDGVPNTTQDLAPPAGVVADNQGRLYTIDWFGNSYLITADGKVSPTGFPPTFDTSQLAIDAKGRVYLMSFFNLIRVSPDGKQETIVALPPPPGPPLGFGPTWLRDIGIDPAGNVYFTGTYYGGPTDYVFRVNDDGTVTPVYGGAANPLHLVYYPPSLAVDSYGNVWMGNSFVNANGAYTLGRQDTGYSGDGGLAQSARFNASAGVFAPNGDLYLLDSYAGRIRKLSGMSAVPPAVIAGGGIVNAVSYTGGTIAPGELISIFGSGFAATGLEVNDPENNRVPWVMGRTKVLFDGFAGAIAAMTPTQINVFVPYFMEPGKTTAVTVQTDAAVSAPVLIPVANAAPGLATAILNQDSSLNGPANPAAPGSVISLFGTGEGYVSPYLLLGDLSISTPFSTPVGAVSVTIGGQPASVTYAGAAPLAPIGVFQINVKIPATLSPGSVAVSAGGIASSKPVTVAIR